MSVCYVYMHICMCPVVPVSVLGRLSYLYYDGHFFCKCCSMSASSRRGFQSFVHMCMHANTWTPALPTLLPQPHFSTLRNSYFLPSFSRVFIAICLPRKLNLLACLLPFSPPHSAHSPFRSSFCPCAKHIRNS